MPTRIGVPHPFLFALQQKQLRLLFIRSFRYVELVQYLESLVAVDILPTRGYHDVVIFHLDGGRYSLDYQLGSVSRLGLHENQDNFWFEAETFFKFGGALIGDLDAYSLSAPQMEIINDVILLSMDWDILNETQRSHLIQRHLILEQPQDIRELEAEGLRRALVFVHVTSPTRFTREDFEARVLSKLRNDERVVSILSGQSDGAEFQYMLEVIANPYETDRLAYELQREALDRNIHASTRTIDLETPIKSELWQSLAYPRITDFESRIFTRLFDPTLGAPRDLPFDRLAARWADAEPFIERLHEALNTLESGLSEELKNIQMLIEKAMLSGEKEDYATPTGAFVDYISSGLIENYPDIRQSLRTGRRTSGTVFDQYFNITGTSTDDEIKTKIRRLNTIRIWFAHPARYKRDLEASDVPELNELFCAVMQFFCSRRSDVGW